MQYTASSFADFLVQLFRFGLRSEKHGNRVRGLFPERGGFACHTPDVVLDRLLIPVFIGSSWLFQQLRSRFHNGSMALYLFYVFLTVVALWATLTR